MPMSRRRTLRGRLSFVALAVIATWLVVLTVALNVFVRQSLYRAIDDRLKVRAQAAATTVDIRDGRIVGLRKPVIARLDSSVWVYSDAAAVLRPDAEPPLQLRRTTWPAARRGLPPAVWTTPGSSSLRSSTEADGPAPW